LLTTISFSLGKLFGTTHTCIGQEAIAVGVLNHFNKKDIVVSNHRCHGHYIAFTGDIIGLLAEIMGKEGGVCKGRGGSQHLQNGNFFSNGVQGNMFPVAAGMAYAEKEKCSDAILVIFIGDGTFGEGVVYETLNLVSLWEAPMLIVVENNRYAQSTSIEKNFTGSFSGRATAFNISVGEIETNDVEKINNRFETLVNKVRIEGNAHMEVVHTYRTASHSKSDDFRDPGEIEEWEKKDPIILMRKKLKGINIENIVERVDKTIDKAEKIVREMRNAEIN
jgi:TPP-dependent pyruvate/acetoin dehydrogenase alpha subunit